MDGDRYTTFFHKVTKIQKTSKQMTILHQGDHILHKQANIKSHVLQFFEGLYASLNCCSSNTLVQSIILHVVSS